MCADLFEVRSAEVSSQAALCEQGVEALNALLTGGKHFSIHYVTWQSYAVLCPINGCANSHCILLVLNLVPAYFISYHLIFVIEERVRTSFLLTFFLFIFHLFLLSPLYF